MADDTIHAPSPWGNRILTLAAVGALSAAVFVASAPAEIAQVEVAGVEFATLQFDENLTAEERYRESRAALSTVMGTQSTAALAAGDAYFSMLENSGTAFLEESLASAEQAVAAFKENLSSHAATVTDYDRAVLSFEMARRDYYKSLIAQRAGDAS